MMTRLENPWENMQSSSQRRISSDKHDLFWITDLEGKYGIFLRSKERFKNFDVGAKLKGMSHMKKNTTTHGELYLVLTKKEEWQIFFTLCEDLISTTQKYDDDLAMISAVEVRLRRWQQLLQQERNEEMTLERQMGLFSELSCLRDIIAPKIGIKQAVKSWVGADFDKQDFLLDSAIIEVKSHRTSKGAKINISSIEQLHSEKEPLFLVSYSLTSTENGLDLNDLIREIEKILDFETNSIFEEKLNKYGYFHEVMKLKKFAFIVDMVKAFQVSDEFPKIVPPNVKMQISNVKYSIDLHHCVDFEIAIEEILSNPQ